MQIKFLCPRWGSENLTWDDFIAKVKAAGYDGIECGLPCDTSRSVVEEIFEKCQQNDLLFIPQHWDTYEPHFELHKEKFAKWFSIVETILPLFINSQTGKDFFTLEQNAAIISIADDFTQRTGVPVYHETHRNKFSFAAHITKPYFDALPFLQITLDASHWVNVAESFLEDQPENINAAIERTAHIHARVGHPQAPQISDPRAPEWKHAVDHYITWWDKVVELKRLQNAALLTIAPEFGPYPYLVHLPYSQQPIANQWDINVYMMELLKKRYAGKS